MQNNCILKGDCIDIMKSLPSESIDFCFADPPYFLQIDSTKELFRVEGTKFQGCDDKWDKFNSMDEYKCFTRNWISEVRRILKPNGLFCVIGGMQSIYEIGNIIRELDFWVINDIIWNKSNPTPNFSGSRLNNSHETLIVSSKSKKSKFTFNYKTGKELNNGKQMGSVWNIAICSGNQRLKDEFGNKVHNTQKPEELLYRIISLFTKIGDLVLDPFGGTMTTAAVCKRMGRNYIMIEKDYYYIKEGEKRLTNIKPKIGDIERAIFDIKPLKVTMKDMIKDGFYIVGEKFYINEKEAILYDELGKLKYNDVISSMHDIAGIMIGKNNRVNGFSFFKVKRNNKLVSIDDIRNKYREYKLNEEND